MRIVTLFHPANLLSQSVALLEYAPDSSRCSEVLSDGREVVWKDSNFPDTIRCCRLVMCNLIKVAYHTLRGLIRAAIDTNSWITIFTKKNNHKYIFLCWNHPELAYKLYVSRPSKSAALLFCQYPCWAIARTKLILNTIFWYIQLK